MVAGRKPPHPRGPLWPVPPHSPVAHLLHGVMGELAADVLTMRVTWQVTKVEPAHYYVKFLFLHSFKTFSFDFSKKLNQKLPHDPATPLLGISRRKDTLCPHKDWQLCLHDQMQAVT